MKNVVAGIVCVVAMGMALACRAVAVDDTVKSPGSRFLQLNKTYAKSPNDVAVLYQMALYYADSSNAGYSLPVAMKFIQRAEEQHINLLDRDKVGELTRLEKKGINLTSIRHAKQRITDAAYRAVERTPGMDKAEMEAYQEAFGIDNALVKKLRQRRIQQVYAEAVSRGTIDAYYQFCTFYPGTTEAEQMEARVARLAPSLLERCSSLAEIDSVAGRYPESPSVQREATKRRSRYAYEAACRENTSGAFKSYLRRFPTSNESMPARDRLEALLEAEYTRLEGAQAYADFIDSNSDSPLADRALADLRRLITENNDALAAEIYLARYPMDAAYNNIFGRYYSWHSEEGNGSPIQIFAQTYPNFPFQRALEEDLDFAQRADKVNLMEEFIEVDYPKYASHVRQLYGKRIAFVPLQRMIQGQLAAKNYRAALDRILQFDICFDNVMHKEYLELQRLLSTQTKGHTASEVMSAGYDIDNPALNESDGKLYFTRINGPARRICFAVKQGKKWVPAQEVRFLNADNDGLTLFGFYDGGQHMLLGKDGDIWIAQREGEDWRIAEIPPYPLNSDYVETDAYMLPDGSGMLFASDRPYGHNRQPSGAYFHGDTALATDLYFIPRTHDGWGTPVNLGLDINTPYCERHPIMSCNLRTLYFVSDGRGGLGYGDIFVAERTNTADWTHWSAPQNAGRDINTGFREAGLGFAPGEREVIFSSNASKGHFAAYSFRTWHNPASPSADCSLEVLGMDGYLYRVMVADLASQRVTQVIHCDGSCHKVDISVQQGNQYVVLGDAGIYFVPAVKVDPSARQHPRLKGFTYPVLVASDRPVTLDAVEFEPATSRLTPIALLQLEQLATFIDRHPTCIVEFSVDVPGRDADQAYALSLERGNALKSSLVSNGISPDRIAISAYGNVHAKASGNAEVAVRFRER